jgi:predicted RNA binding protein YcfA (HicA-like mRNA interferase family)
MKRVDLIREIERFGCMLIRHGAKHDWYRNPNTGVSQPVPRHREINEQLARKIIRMLRNPDIGEQETQS